MPREFKSSFKQEEFTVTNDDGTSAKYFMMTMSGGAREQYLNGLFDRFGKNDKGEVTGIKNYRGLHANLLTRCVQEEYQNKGKTDRRFISPQTVENWPHDTMEEIFKWAKEFNGLDQEADEDAKKDSEESGSSGSESQTV